ncbi:G patch domain-containing protein 4-like [Gouania willdenowi]|uniref:G patch domain-containing protein 4-like n=1 Tax=Gouania willdenowi TaxID=441366 RepID=UPI001055A95B|nr:G patch domain-containing protein 4-like [Gouania willdenowi]
MVEGVPEKSRGLKFAEQQLLRHGWEHGETHTNPEDKRTLGWKSFNNAQLIKACGGRTAHKGVRHGLTISAKLARLEQQEAEFMARYGKKSQSGSLQTLPTKEEEETQQRKKKMMKQRLADGEEEVTENGVQPKKKKKKEEEVEAGRGEGNEKKRKTKLKRNESHSIESEALPPGTEDEKKKKKQPQVEAAEEKEEIRDVSVKQRSRIENN